MRCEYKSIHMDINRIAIENTSNFDTPVIPSLKNNGKDASKSIEFQLIIKSEAEFGRISSDHVCNMNAADAVKLVKKHIFIVFISVTSWLSRLKLNLILNLKTLTSRNCATSNITRNPEIPLTNNISNPDTNGLV